MDIHGWIWNRNVVRNRKENYHTLEDRIDLYEMGWRAQAFSVKAADGVTDLCR
ncbi:MAG: hypothetical protein ACLU4J_06835 [Butyricimonas paravirosa]